MSSKGNIQKWLIAEWSSVRGVVNSRSLVKMEHEVSKLENSMDSDNAEARNTRDITSHERSLAQRQKTGKVNKNIEDEGTSAQKEDLDFSSSASSWEPSDEDSSEDSEVDESKTKVHQSIKQYCNRKNKKGPTPLHRPNAVIPNILQERNSNNIRNGNRRHRFIEQIHKNNRIKKSLPDSTRKSTPPTEDLRSERVENLNVNVKDIIDIKNSFRELFQILNELKPQREKHQIDLPTIKRVSTINHTVIDASDGEEDSGRSQSEESNRSDDNVLITNKYDKALVRQKSGDKVDEWIPIGSGKTLIHKDKYRKINWRSYTIATRSLLLATFPRRILATHSLTGKRSPAFQDKPAKMCLDPKIVSDVIIEITSRFKVKENLVRSIITTKCADESKMLKMKLKQRSKHVKDEENTEEQSPEKNNTM